MNFAPQDSTSAALQPEDTDALLAVLRQVARDPRIGKLLVGGVQYAGTARLLPSGRWGGNRLSGARRGAPVPKARRRGSTHTPGQKVRPGVPDRPFDDRNSRQPRPARRRHHCGAKNTAWQRGSPGCFQGIWRSDVSGVLFELRFGSDGQPLARRHRQCRARAERFGVPDQQAARRVLRLERDRGPYCKFEIREVAFVSQFGVR